MSRHVVIGLVLLGTGGGRILCGQSFGSITGTIAGDDGKMLVATITANSNGKPPASARTTSAADGTFTLSNLPAGAYTLCAAVQGGGYLNPCTWAGVPSTVQVAAGQAVKAYRLTVTKGALIQVHLDDPAGVLATASTTLTQTSAPAGPVAAPTQTVPHVLLGVVTDKRIFEPLILTGKSATGQDHQGTVPLNASVHLDVSGTGVQIKDATGTSLAPIGSVVTVQTANGTTPATVTLNVSAK